MTTATTTSGSWFSLEDYCVTQRQRRQTNNDWSDLPSSSRAFLDNLDLPAIHPYCTDPSLFYTDATAIEYDNNNLIFPRSNDSSSNASHRLYDQPSHTMNTEAIVTSFYRTVTPLLGFLELWVRLLSGVVAPVGLLFLVWDERCHHRRQGRSLVKEQHSGAINEKSTGVGVICMATVASSLIIMTDNLYVVEYGSAYGLALFLASVALSARSCLRRRRRFSGRRDPFLGLAAALGAALFLTCWDGGNIGLHFGEPREVNLRVPGGLYYDPSNSLINATISRFPERFHTYSVANGATPWMYSGDARTGLPFFLNRGVPDPDWKRVFLTADDGEILALDIAFPQLGGHNTDKPLYLVLHGINGGSSEEFIKDLAHRRTSHGSTVVVMICRGFMDLPPLRGWNVFHGGTWSDVHTAATTLRRRVLAPGQALAGVGYSMGAIVLSNYAAGAGVDCALDVAFAISGGLECRAEESYYRPRRLWFPMIAENIRASQHLAKFPRRMKARLGSKDMLAFLRATHLAELDYYTAVKYSGFRDLEDFYSAMGALGDIPLRELHGPPERVQSTNARLFNLSIPLCVLNAFDDPISTWRTVTANEGFMRPEALVRAGKGNLVLLLTETGGHVGWPLGWLPFRRKWEFMNEAAAAFVDAFVDAFVQSRQGDSYLGDDCREE